MSGGKKPSIFSALAAKFSRSKAARQIFICGGPDCCTREQGIESHEALKADIARLGLDSGEGSVRCVKTGCLGVCGNGPIAVVYPGEVWYEQMTPVRLARVAEEHLAQGRTVEDFSFTPPPDARPPLT